MPSKWGQIETLLKTHIETTSIVVCTIEAPNNQSKSPIAEFYWGGGDNPPAAGNGATLDWNGAFVLRIKAGGREAVQLACEELLLLWFNQAKRDALGLLGVVSILPVSSDPPLLTPGGKQTVIADMEFSIQVRYS